MTSHATTVTFDPQGPLTLCAITLAHAQWLGNAAAVAGGWLYQPQLGEETPGQIAAYEIIRTRGGNMDNLVLAYMPADMVDSSKEGKSVRYTFSPETTAEILAALNAE